MLEDAVVISSSSTSTGRRRRVSARRRLTISARCQLNQYSAKLTVDGVGAGMEGLGGAEGPLVLHIVLKVSRGMISVSGVGCRVSVLTPGGMVMMQLGLLGDGDETDVQERSGVEDAKGCEAAREERKWVWLAGSGLVPGVGNALLTVPRDRQGRGWTGGSHSLKVRTLPNPRLVRNPLSLPAYLMQWAWVCMSAVQSRWPMHVYEAAELPSEAEQGTF